MPIATSAFGTVLDPLGRTVAAGAAQDGSQLGTDVAGDDQHDSRFGWAVNGAGKACLFSICPELSGSPRP
jgi:hypothetical protein